MKLTVKKLAVEDTLKDIVRIKKPYRRDRNDRHIPRGSICRIAVGDKSKWVIVHGREPNDRDIQVVLVKRDPLQSPMIELARAGVRRGFSP
jgi:hypothetical protein